jgi:hypothetical protein
MANKKWLKRLRKLVTKNYAHLDIQVDALTLDDVTYGDDVIWVRGWLAIDQFSAPTSGSLDKFRKAIRQAKKEEKKTRSELPSAEGFFVIGFTAGNTWFS